ncbi:putative long chain fatty alcohol oxidase [Aureobasidium subglaciale]|nr:putative long chain fatty alcohol oxidase [Aureobasidium subglaciale]
MVPMEDVHEPTLPEAPPFNDQHWKTLCSLADAIIPCVNDKSGPNEGEGHFQPAYSVVTRPSDVGDELAREYLAETPSLVPEFKDALARIVFDGINATQRRELFLILSILGNRTSTFLTGYVTPFTALPVYTRSVIIQGWDKSRLPILRKLHKTFTQLMILAWIRTSPSLRRVLSFPEHVAGHNFGPGFDFNFERPWPTSEKPEVAGVDSTIVLETDILVLGSGCTGAVAAASLAAQGLEVMVADKGYYWSPQCLPMTEDKALHNLFENGGLTGSESGNIYAVSGSCFGGGGTVNWSASLQLQEYVRREWASQHGLPYFTSSAFQADMDAVCQRMGVGVAEVKQNFTNQRLLSGARKLGMNASVVPQNTGGAAHECGLCTLGCGSCGKKGPTETWLPDAARNGARFIEGFSCSQLLFSTARSDCRNGNRKAIGAFGIWSGRKGKDGITRSRRLRIVARRAVVLATGALATPHLLQRSGIRNPHLGEHLKLHPVSFLSAVYDEDIRPWEGAILTSVVKDFESISSGYGVKLEATVMVPSMFLLLFPWSSGLDWKTFCAKMRRMTGYISLARDTGEGKITMDPSDSKKIRLSYDVSKKDGKHIATGLVALAKIQFIEGAREIHVSVPGMHPYVREDRYDRPGTETSTDLNDPAFCTWLARLERYATMGMPAHTTYGSAHQMGTARMAASPELGVVDPHGLVWGCEALYVVDTSVLPGATGVNPMITAMATARGISRGIPQAVSGASGAEPSRAKL